MKILVLSPNYPRLDSKHANISTSVVHYFVKEWVKEGHQILVINNPNVYLKFMYMLPDGLKMKLKTLTGKTIQDIEITKEKKYIIDDVQVYRIPLKKNIFNRKSNKKVLSKHIRKIKNIMDESNFTPDLVIGHWLNPELQILALMKREYNLKTILILHGQAYLENQIINIEKYKNFIDVFGCRSYNDVSDIRKRLNLSYDPFVCSSGIPNSLIKNSCLSYKSIKAEMQILYVGELIKRKNVITILKALKLVRFKYHFNIIGSGAEEERLKKFTIENHMTCNVSFLGQMNRDDVYKYMKNANVFIMVSKKEIFGLVYLEAMCNSCVTIGSKGEGIDGIIKNKVNGYLVDSDDYKELVLLLNNINENCQDEIVKKGYETAITFSDRQMAKVYLKEAIDRLNYINRYKNE